MCCMMRLVSGVFMKINFYYRVMFMMLFGFKNLRRMLKVFFVLFLVYGMFYIKGYVYYVFLCLF